MIRNKVVVSVTYLIVAIVILVYHSQIIAWIKQDHQYAWLFLSIAAIVIALVPIVPYGVVGALIGAKYGVIAGGLINVIYSTIAGVIIFILIRYVFQHKGRKIIDKYKYTASFTLLLERHPFFSILIGRLIPIMPAIFINSYTAISNISILHFTLATLIGKIPVMVLFSIIGNQLVNHPQHALLTILIYCLLLGAILLAYKLNMKVKATKAK